MDGNGKTLAHAWAPNSPCIDKLGEQGSNGGDLHFDAEEHWRLDSPLPAEQGQALVFSKSPYMK